MKALQIVVSAAVAHEAEVTRHDASRFAVEINGILRDIELYVLDHDTFQLGLDGSWYLLRWSCQGDEVRLNWQGNAVNWEVMDRAKLIALRQFGAGVMGLQKISSSMPGRVVKLLVEEGQRVAAGDGVIVIEAMKMENILRAEAPGVVTAIHVQAGENADGGAELLRIEAEDEA
jgi:biotin carboxyl carrier protein